MFLGATGQLSGIWLGLWVSASGGAAQSASIFIINDRSVFEWRWSDGGKEHRLLAAVRVDPGLLIALFAVLD